MVFYKISNDECLVGYRNRTSYGIVPLLLKDSKNGGMGERLNHHTANVANRQYDVQVRVLLPPQLN